jgi:hypothetical protein
VWWVAGVIFAVLAFFVLLDALQDLRHRRSFARWLRAERLAGGGPAPRGPVAFRVGEAQHPLRGRFLRRIPAGFSSLARRGFGEVPWRDPGDWSPLDTRPGKHGPK